MKTLLKNSAVLIVALFLGVSFQGFAHTPNPDNPKNLLKPVEKRGKYAKLDVSTLPKDTPVVVRVRDDVDNLVYEFNVINRGQKEVVVDFNRLKTGVYSMNILRGENDVIRKVLNIHWDQVIVNDVMALSRDRGNERYWPFFMMK
ncbi:hypothetical protein ADIS_1861 [Lunatimonas lonarensis]|uniref:Secretion system C-terminal sorting domain-containing protein n=1 Tax=Lunatimonas lonarensis TaxID=1232681 RepID=R7ZUA0_9BACT|nr:hypothetical protein [Lunatimonas lonarensis]EON77642.1 hypothetical protein ADIS_1861 [Lunatimonas lonarensis]